MGIVPLFVLIIEEIEDYFFWVIPARLETRTPRVYKVTVKMRSGILHGK
jgi:hypothetical protein